ncbi:MAG TPA: Gfo/Idh/MocA family oxidoreductase [Gaiellaceae bacterium]|nr:Gfo/Idh/MocA family oxidoreductase [Gaiellaceae bacterium]
MSAERVRVGVVGAGWWSTLSHLPALVANERAELSAVADRDPARLARAVAAHGAPRAFADHRELLAAGVVDALVVAVPHAAHFEVARDALAAGVHVVVEKPMTIRAADAWELVRLARERRLHLVVGYTYQFSSHARRAKQAFESGELGELLLVSGLFSSIVEAFYRGDTSAYDELFDFQLEGPQRDTYSDPAISGGGQGTTQVTHAMGMVHWLTGARADEVFAHMAQRDLAVDLADAISYRLDGGAIGTMASTGSLRLRQPEQQELRYYGSEGFMLQDIRNGTLEIHRNDGTSEVLPQLPKGPERYPAAGPTATIVDLVLGLRDDNPAPAEAGAATVEFLELAYRSAAEHRPITRGAAPPAR